MNQSIEALTPQVMEADFQGKNNSKIGYSVILMANPSCEIAEVTATAYVEP